MVLPKMMSHNTAVRHAPGLLGGSRHFNIDSKDSYINYIKLRARESGTPGECRVHTGRSRCRIGA